MRLHLNPDHSIFGQAPQVNHFFNAFAKAQGLSYFQFARFYADGSLLVLLNRVDLFQKFIDLGWGSFSSLREEDKDKCSYSFFWDEDLPSKPVALARSYGMYHGMTLIHRSRNFYDMIAFARDKPCPNPGGYYLTHLRVLENFALSFEKAFRPILTNPKPHIIYPPSHQQDPNCSFICLGSRKILLHGRQGKTHITARELECLQLWSRHLTLKEIGNHLTISPRTVETFLARAVERTDLTLPELTRSLMICP